MDNNEKKAVKRTPEEKAAKFQELCEKRVQKATHYLNYAAVFNCVYSDSCIPWRYISFGVKPSNTECGLSVL